MALAAVAMVSLVGMMAFVIDAGTFFVIRRELQNAADAGALAGAMYMSPWGPGPPTGISSACSSMTDPSGPFLSYRNDEGVQAACHYVSLNLGQATRLCNTQAHLKSAYTREEAPPTYPTPNYHVLVIEVACDAQYSFGRILNLGSREINAYAIATLGRWDGTTFQPFSSVPVPGSTDASRLLPE
jgi:hypothetical protein